MSKTSDKNKFIEWPSIKDGTIYRVVLRDEKQNVKRTIYEGKDVKCIIPQDFSTEIINLKARVEILKKNNIDQKSQWKTYLPFFSLGELSIDHAVYTSECPSAHLYRIYIRNARDNSLIFDDNRLGNAFTVPSGTTLVDTPVRYKFMYYSMDKQSWIDIGTYKDGVLTTAGHILERMSVSASREPQKNNEIVSPEIQRPYFFTIDVEANMRLMELPDFETACDEHIFGKTKKTNGHEFGVNFIMEKLDEYGIKGTFFVDVLLEYQFGRNALEKTIDAIQSKGHDIQLHLHPSPNLLYSNKNELIELAIQWSKSQSDDVFRKVLGLAVEIFEKRTGNYPVAFRNGSYHLCDEYFKVLSEFGIKIDSSLYAFKNCMTSPWMMARLVPFEAPHGVIEVPVSWCLINKKDRGTTVSQYTLKVGSQSDIVLNAMNNLWMKSAAPVVTLIHSYSLLAEERCAGKNEINNWNSQLKSIVNEDIYNSLYLSETWKKVHLDGKHESRLEALEKYLETITRNKNVKCITFSMLKEIDVGLILLNNGSEPLVEYDSSNSSFRTTRLQHYSSSYLKYLTT